MVRNIPSFCSNCGFELKDLNQRFCQECGFELASVAEQAPESAPAATELMGLFDIRRSYYVLKEKYWDWGSGDILDENN
ncbi:unnamed protein product, partial [marine sediment metagenome]